MNKQDKCVPGHFLLLHALEDALKAAVLSPSLTKNQFNDLYKQFEASLENFKQKNSLIELTLLLKEKDLDLSIDGLVDLSTKHSKATFLKEKELIKAVVPKIYELLSNQHLTTENRSLLNIAIKKMATLYVKEEKNLSKKTTAVPLNLGSLLTFSNTAKTYEQMIHLFDISKALFDNDLKKAQKQLLQLVPSEKLSLFHHLNHLNPVDINAHFFSFETLALLKSRKMDIIRSLLALAWEMTHRAHNPFYYTNFEIRQLFNEAGRLPA